MRAWCVVVPREKGEEVRRLLQDRGALLKHLRVRREGDRLLLPVATPIDLGWPTEEHEVDEAFVPVRSYKDVVRVPESLRSQLPRSFDVIGDIAVLKIPEPLVPLRREIGRAILQWNPSLRVVAQDHGVEGDLRIRRLDIIAGEDRTTTVHTEFGLRYHVDVARAYFSPRLGTERLRVAREVQPGEVVADPFAGVGPYAILIAKRRQPRRVVASDANPVAVDLLRRNVASNHAEAVEVREGDARAVLRGIAPVDRILLDLPHSAADFLPAALAALRSRGVVHVYGIVEDADVEDRAGDVARIVEREGRSVLALRAHAVRAYSPSSHHVAFDVTVGPA